MNLFLGNPVVRTQDPLVQRNASGNEISSWVVLLFGKTLVV